MTQSTYYRRYKLLAHLPHHSQTTNSERERERVEAKSATAKLSPRQSSSTSSLAQVSEWPRVSRRNSCSWLATLSPLPLKAWQKGYSTLDCYSTGVFCINFSRSTNSKGRKPAKTSSWSQYDSWKFMLHLNNKTVLAVPKKLLFKNEISRDYFPRIYFCRSGLAKIVRSSSRSAFVLKVCCWRYDYGGSFNLRQLSAAFR